MILGIVAIWLVWSGAFGSFVHQRMRWPLAIAGVMLITVGIIEMVTAERTGRQDPDSGRRFAAPSVGWLLMLPVVVLMAVAPSALGATAAGRASGFVPDGAREIFERLPDTTDPIPMRVYDFVDRAVWDPMLSLEFREIELEGIVVNDDRYPDGFVLVRFAVSCCAADGVPLRVAFPDAPENLADDTWISAVVRWIPPPEGTYFNVPDVPFAIDGDLYIEADLLSFRILDDPPDSPYESPA